MSLARTSSIVRNPGFPRVSGDEPEACNMGEFTPAFSPRERG